MKYTLEELMERVPEIRVKEYLSKMERRELIRLGIIAGVAGALTVTTAIIISKKLRKKKKVQVIEVTSDENLKEE